MILSAFFVLSSRTAFKIAISSSRSGSSPVLWNWRNDFNSAFLYVWWSWVPKTASSSRAIGHAIGAANNIPFVRTWATHSIRYVPRIYIRARTSFEHFAPMARPWCTLIACGMILEISVRRWKRSLLNYWLSEIVMVEEGKSEVRAIRDRRRVTQRQLQQTREAWVDQEKGSRTNGCSGYHNCQVSTADLQNHGSPMSWSG